MNLTSDSKVIIQGITGLETVHALRMKAYGTNVVAGINPGQGGQTVDDIPIFDLVEQAVAAVGAIDTSIIFVDPYLALDAALEAISAGIKQIILTTNGVPPLDMVYLLRKAEATNTVVLGPGSAGIIVPEKLLLGTQETQYFTSGTVGIISRSISLNYEIASALTKSGFGQSIAISLGSEPMIGSFFVPWLQLLEADKNTKVIVLVGQNGGSDEEAAANYIAENINKPTIAYIAGRHAAPEKKLGDIDAVIFSQLGCQVTDSGTAERKISAFKHAKIPLADRPSQIPDLVKKALKK